MGNRLHRALLHPVLAAALLAALPAAAQKPVAADPGAVWTALQQSPFDPNKSAAVEDITLVRDRIRITLADGTIQFAKPAAGRYFAAAFEGHGRLELTPPNRIEAKQLKFLAKQSPLDIPFTRAVFSFTDNTYRQVAREVRWVTAKDDSLEKLYRERQKKREERAGQFLPRLFQALLASRGPREDFFLAELKTKRGWVVARYDGARLEQVSIQRWYRGYFPYIDTYDGWKLETWTSFPAGGRNPLLVDEKPLAKHVFLVHSCRVDATVNARGYLSAGARLDLRLLQSGERVLLFRLDANLRLSSVRDTAGHRLFFFQPPTHTFVGLTHGDYAAVALARPTRAGHHLTLEFQYAGKHALEANPFWSGADVFVRGDYDWYPYAQNALAMHSKFRLTFHTPSRFLLFASGRPAGRRVHGREVTTTWKGQTPFAMVGFGFGPYNLHSLKVGSTDLQVLVDPGEGWITMAPVYGRRKDVQFEGGNLIRLFDLYFGRYPYGRLSVITHSDTPGDGWPMLDYQGIVGVVSYVDSAAGFSDQWWGQNVRPKTDHDRWLIDSLTYFASLLYIQYRTDADEYHLLLKIGARQTHPAASILPMPSTFSSIIPGSPSESLDSVGPSYAVHSPDVFSGYFRLPTYNVDTLGPIWLGKRLASSWMPIKASLLIKVKGARLLDRLRMMLWDPASRNPDHRFQAMLRDFQRTFAGRAASTLDFQAIVEKHMIPVMDLEGNHRMAWFFRQYVLGTGQPRYSLSYRLLSAAGGKWKVEGSLTRTGVRDDWMDVLPVYGRFRKSDRELGLLQVRSPKVRFQFTLPEKPRAVLLDDGGRILKALPTTEPASAIP